MSFSEHRYALWVLLIVSFIESSFFPIPPDPLLLTMMLSNRKRIWEYALLCTIASVTGGYLGYAIGYLFYEIWEQTLMQFYGFTETFEKLRHQFNEWGFWIVAGKGLTPIPYKIVTIASGLTGLDLQTFTLASLIARGLRFFSVGAILWYCGPLIRTFIEENLSKVFYIGIAIFIIGYVIVKYTI
jgi:membrane protein YqaA with SNARE-associated domain